MHYTLTAIVTLLSLTLYWLLTANVGRARGKYKIEAPAVTGHIEFERIFRVQQNTMESMTMHIPALWLFAFYVSDLWAAILGSVWIVGRMVYAQGYYAEARRRGTGVII